MKYLPKAGVARLTKKPDDSGYEIAPPPTPPLSSRFLFSDSIRSKLLQKELGSLSSSVFERWTSTGSGLFASLGSGLVETLG